MSSFAGFDVTNTNNAFSQLSIISQSDSRRRLGEHLRDHGYAIVRLDVIRDDEASSRSMVNWESVFKSAFDSLNERDHASSTPISRYRAEKGMTLGYRRDDEHREFLETRRGFEPGSLDPSFCGVEGYNDTALTMFNLLGAIGHTVISCMSQLMGVDPHFFIDLIDPPQISESDQFSSSVLRICHYSNSDAGSCHQSQESKTQTEIKSDATLFTPRIAFGSHTDTSFVTVAPVSSSKGLEIMDLSSGCWLRPEENCDAYSVVVFTGEVMQILSRSYFRAAVHRVIFTEVNTNRVSCPLIIRGRKKAIIKPLSHESYRHLMVNLAERIPDFSDTNMNLIHKMLDLKRQKCIKSHSNDQESDWVLAAFPVVIGSNEILITAEDNGNNEALVK